MEIIGKNPLHPEVKYGFYCMVLSSSSLFFNGMTLRSQEQNFTFYKNVIMFVVSEGILSDV